MNNKKYFKPQRTQRSQRINYSLRSDSSEIPKRNISEFSVSSVAKQKEFKNLSLSVCILMLSFLPGCGKNFHKPLPICPGKPDVTESLAALKSQSENIIPLFTNKGSFSIEYYENKEMRKQHFSIRVLLIKPPSEIYMQASTGIIEKAMVLGSNEREFWLEVKPDPISSYWWGLWSQQNSNTGMLINPKTLLDALGIAEIDMNATWSLSNEGPYDVLTKTVQGVVNKKLYVYCCDYRVRKIEYFDNEGKPVAFVKLDKYTEVSPGFLIPFSIVINSVTKDIEDTFNVNIEFDSVRAANEKEKKFNIVRPKPDGLDHIYQVINGQWVEQ
jgi:hypothetical protein